MNELDNGYTVKHIAGCTLVFGPIPLSDIGRLTHGMGKDVLVDIRMADRLGASLVLGTRQDLDHLAQMNLPVSGRREADARTAAARGLPDEVCGWLREGERGLSSCAMCARIFGVPESSGGEHPRDADDLRRCVQFVAQTGCRDRLALMNEVSPYWAALVAEWESLAGMLNGERGGGVASGSRTSQRMRALFDAVDGAAHGVRP